MQSLDVKLFLLNCYDNIIDTIEIDCDYENNIEDEKSIIFKNTLIDCLNNYYKDNSIDYIINCENISEECDKFLLLLINDQLNYFNKVNSKNNLTSNNLLRYINELYVISSQYNYSELQFILNEEGDITNNMNKFILNLLVKNCTSIINPTKINNFKRLLRTPKVFCTLFKSKIYFTLYLLNPELIISIIFKF
jgi:hypothetical protein